RRTDAQTLRRSDAQTHSATPRPSLCVCRVCASSLMRPGGLEPPTSWSVAKRSIQLSYGRHSFPAGIESTDGQTVRQRARETSRRLSCRLPTQLTVCPSPSQLGLRWAVLDSN